MLDGHISKRRILTLGADPEMFVFSGARLIPAFEFLPAKDTGALMFWDGFQVEWKYEYEGKYCQNNLVYYTRNSLMQLEERAKKTDNKAHLSLASVVRIPREMLETADPRHVELGCQPSYNVYNLKGKPVYDPRKLLIRFAGGHKHFGTWKRRPNYEKIVKTLDSILGVWAVGAARHMDNPIRRQYYGLPGEYRKPKYKTGYGVEYRVLSNFWLASPGILQLTWDIGRMCVRLAHSKYGGLWAGNEQETIETIQNCDVDQADRILSRNKPMFRWILKQCYKTPKAIDTAVSIAHEGLESIVHAPEDFRNNWHFGEEWWPNARQLWARWETSL